MAIYSNLEEAVSWCRMRFHLVDYHEGLFESQAVSDNLRKLAVRACDVPVFFASRITSTLLVDTRAVSASVVLIRFDHVQDCRKILVRCGPSNAGDWWDRDFLRAALDAPISENWRDLHALLTSRSLLDCP